MQLASSGARGLASTGRQASHTLGHPPSGGHTRGFHIPAFPPRPATGGAKPSGSTVQTVFKQTRTYLSKFASLLTAPAKYATTANIPGAGRSLTYKHAALRGRTIQEGLSFTTRQTLARPMWAPCLPRPPIVQRGMFEVGLGTARKFSTSRPLFQNVADNMPIAGRAFWEPDWELKVGAEKKRLELRKKKQDKENVRPQHIVLHSPVSIKSYETSSTASIDSVEPKELDHYFPLPAEPEVTTYLLIPLVPTPTSRLPLPISPPVHTSSHPLLPFSTLSSIHKDYGAHSLRVSTLFSRLDSCQVFKDPSVSCCGFGDPTGLCSVLEVKFTGWTGDCVRSLLGELGTGWCLLDEVRHEDEVRERDAMEEVLSEISSADVSNPDPHPPVAVEMDPARSFVLPTLDFSASFPGLSQSDVWASSSSTSRPAYPDSEPLSDLAFHNAWTRSHPPSSASSECLVDDPHSDSGSDIEYLSDVDGSAWGSSFSISPPVVSEVLRPPSRSSSDSWMGLGFSSQFRGRVESTVNVNVVDDGDIPEPSDHWVVF